jgi:hypothetical protein
VVPRLDARAATLVRFTGLEGALLRGEQAELSNGLGEERSALQPPQHNGDTNDTVVGSAVSRVGMANLASIEVHP